MLACYLCNPSSGFFSIESTDPVKSLAPPNGRQKRQIRQFIVQAYLLVVPLFRTDRNLRLIVFKMKRLVLTAKDSR